MLHSIAMIDIELVLRKPAKKNRTLVQWLELIPAQPNGIYRRVISLWMAHQPAHSLH